MHVPAFRDFEGRDEIINQLTHFVGMNHLVAPSVSDARLRPRLHMNVRPGTGH